MLRSFSNPFLIPDDLSVPCRLRRCDDSSSCQDSDSEISHSRQEPEEMTCTMRKWHRETNASSEFMSPHRRNSSKSKTKVDDAELILKPAFRHHNAAAHRRRCMSGEFSAVPKVVAPEDTTTPIPLSKRFASFGTPERIDPEDQAPSKDSWHDIQAPLPEQPRETTIPVKDIIKVVTRSERDAKRPKNIRKRSASVSTKDGSSKEECRQPPTICITTASSAMYELLMESTNEQLVLLTFLKVNSMKEKVSFVEEMDDEQQNTASNPETENCKDTDSEKSSSVVVGESSQNDAKDAEGGLDEFQTLIQTNPSTVTHGTAQSSGERSFDVEALTAKQMAERLKTESLAEKLERRFYRLVSSLDDLSSSLTKCACGCLGDSSVDNTTVLIEKETAPRRRKNTASTVASEAERLEVDPAEESTAFESSTALSLAGGNTTSTSPRKPSISREEDLSYASLPSGLSVAPDDSMLDEAPARGGNYYTTLMSNDI